MRLLALSWASAHILLYLRYGVRIVFDSHRYLAYAESMAAGTSNWLQPDSVLYTSYTLFLNLVLHVLHLPVAYVIAFQILLSGVATLLFYKTLCRATSNGIAAFFGAMLYIIWPQINSWNFYIHTESLYISLTVITLYFVSRFSGKNTQLLPILVLLCFPMLLRPNGLFLAIGAISGLIFYYRRRLRSSHIYLATALALPMLIWGANQVLEVFSPLQYLYGGQAIQGYQSIEVASQNPTPPAGPILLQMIDFLKEQPLAYLKLLLLRFGYLWGQVRPYYSTVHNITIVAFFLPVFTLAIKGMRSARKDIVYIFILTIIALQTIMAMVVAVDWDNRFVAPLLPLVFYFATIGATSLGLQNNGAERA